MLTGKRYFSILVNQDYDIIINIISSNSIVIKAA